MKDERGVMQLPSFSVLVGNYNYGHLVATALRSVLEQDYPAALREVIVVDDGSTDDSRVRLAAFAGVAGVTVVHQDNRGQTATFAAALAHATGDYVCLLDADDACALNKLRALAAHIATLETSPDRLFLCHDLHIVDGAGAEPANVIAQTWFEVSGLRRFGPMLHVAAASHFFPFSVTSGMVFGRRLLQQAMATVPQWEWPQGSDALLGHAAMLICGEVHYLDQTLGQYIVHGGNNFARIDNGEFRQRPVWHGRWPKKLRFLELLLDSLPMGEREREERLAYLGRVEHAVRAVPSGRHHSQPLLSVVVDACGPEHAVHAAATALALSRQSNRHLQVIWLCSDSTRELVPAEDEHSQRLQLAADIAGGPVYARLRAGYQASQGGYLAFLQAGDLPDRHYAERHLQAHRYGQLPMLTACDVRLLSADGAVLHAGVQGIAAGWGTAPPYVPAFAALLRDWALAPLPAIVFRRSPFLQAFFAVPHYAGHERHAPWLLCQFMLQLGGATRLAENLLDLRLPPHATPNASWLSHFVDRQGPLPVPDFALAADALFAAYGRARSNERAYFSEAWEARFLRWLVQSGGADTAQRIERQARQHSDTAWAARILALLHGPAARP